MSILLNSEIRKFSYLIPSQLDRYTHSTNTCHHVKLMTPTTLTQSIWGFLSAAYHTPYLTYTKLMQLNPWGQWEGGQSLDK